METLVGKIEQLIEPNLSLRNPNIWSVRITRVLNGYSIETSDGVTLIECDGLERDTMKSLLEYISEYFGLSDDKWGKENLRITWDRWGREAG